ncbi:MAG TPA: ABC transporter permease [Gemmatimonadaceae bacterium]|jgi:predicted permease|nr:ABC transporter permease [Gemmatimonadaceae bacterium]
MRQSIRAAWDALHHDLVFARRLAWRQKSFTLVALATFALGIGANTAIYTIVRRVVLQPLPFAHPGRLAAIWPARTISNAELEFMQSHARSFDGVGAFSPGWGIAMTNAGEPRQLDGARVSANFFALLGVRPAIGRAFHPDESEPGKWDVVILSDALWRDQFRRDPAIVGRIVDLDGNPSRVVGVMPPGFEAFQAGVDAWLPLQIDRSSRFYTGQTALAFGRLRGTATFASATTEVATLAPRMRAAFNFTEDYGRGAMVTSLQESLVGGSRATLLVLFGAVALLAAIAAANVGSLLVVQAIGRRGELAVRRALGATPAQLVRQLAVQSAMLAIAGGSVGTAAGALGVRMLKAVLPATIPLIAAARIDVSVLVFSCACTIGAGALLCIAPAFLATRVDPNGTLRAGSVAGARGGAAGRGSERTRRAFVTVQMAVAMVLVVGAALMIESLRRIERVDLGFQPGGALTFLIQPSSGQLHDAGQTDVYFREMTRRLSSIAGVAAVGAAQHLPLSGFNWKASLDLESNPIPATAEHPSVTWRSVIGDYFGAMRIPLLRGRPFAETDTRDAPPVVIVNATMARHFWPNADPIGQRIRAGNATQRQWATIVGIVGDVRFDSPDAAPRDEIYRPNAQQGLVFMHFVVRTRRNPLSLLAEVRDAVRSLDSTVPIAQVRGLGDLVSSSIETRRVVTSMLLAFAVLGLTLGAVGVYGVVSYGVSQRTRELGIRAALGAAERRIVTMVVGEGVRTTLLGVALGIVGTAVAARSLQTFVFGIGTADPVTYLVVALVLGGVAVIASIVPAWRAARVDPLVALRGE